MSVETLLDQYRSVGLDHDGQLLLPFPDALRFIEDCRKATLLILRMNFWREREEEITKTKRVVDLSEVAHVRDATDRSAKAAAAMLARPKTEGETLVSFVLQEPKK